MIQRIDVPSTTRIGDLTPQMVSQVNEGLSGERYGKLSRCEQSRSWHYTTPGGLIHTLCPDAMVDAVWLLAEALNVATAPPTERDDRAAALSRCQSGRAMREHELMLSTPGLLGLLRIAATQSGRWVRHDLLKSEGTYRMKGEDLAWLLQKGHLQESGKWVEVTDQGNALVREVLAFAQKWEGGAK